MGGPSGQAVIATAKTSFVEAMNHGLQIGAAVALAGALIAAVWLPNRAAEPATSREPVGADADEAPVPVGLVAQAAEAEA